MPTYTYACKECGSDFEAFASIKKKQAGWQPKCPRCGSSETRPTLKAVATLIGPDRRPPGGGCCSFNGG